MSRKYEGLIVLNSQGQDDGLNDLVSSVAKEMEGNGAKMDEIQQLGRRKFAYNARHLCCASPEGDIHKSGFFNTLTSFTRANSIDGKADVSDGSALRGIAKFDITGYVTHEHYFVKIGHDLNATLLRWWTAIAN